MLRCIWSSRRSALLRPILLCMHAGMEAYLADEASDVGGAGLAQDIGALQVSMQDAAMVHILYAICNV